MATTCQGQSKSRLFHVMNRTTGQQYLVDTGAEGSIIPAQRSDRTTPPTSYLQAANGSRIPVHKSRSLNLMRKRNNGTCGLRRMFRWVFLVADVRRALIGTDFLNHYGPLVDVKSQRLLDTAALLSVHGIVPSDSPIVAPTTTVAGNPFACLLQKFPNVMRPTDWT